MIPWNAALATLMFWAGVIFVVRGLVLWARLLFEVREATASSDGPEGAVNVGLGAVALVGSALLFPAVGVGVPIVWPVLCVQHWGTLLAVIVMILHALGAVVAQDAATRLNKLRNCGLSLVIAVGTLFLPRANQDPPKLLTGHIVLPVAGLIGLGLLTIAVVLGIALASKSNAAKGMVRSIATQIALLAGCVIFGLPFLFLLVTSFKEDKDMSSPNGIIWVPRVKQTAPVLNPKHPYFEATYKGTKVLADLEKQNADGTLTLRIAHPVYFGGYTFEAKASQAKQIPREMPLVTADLNGQRIKGVVFEEAQDGSKDVEIREPLSLKGQHHTFAAKDTEEIRPVSLRWMNYLEALEYLPPEANYGWTYLRNTLWLVVMNVAGALISSSIVAYAFARLRFPGRETLFKVMLSTMMLPAAVTLLPQFLIFRSLGWIDTLKPLWVTSWFAAAFNVFMLRQFFQQVPYELEDAAKIDGCSYLRSLWSVMLPQVKPALAVIAIMTFMGAWNNFMGPLVYSSSPETLPISYAVQLFNGERSGDPGLLMAFVTMSLVPVIALFAFAQRFFIEGVSLSGLGGR